MPDCIVVWRGRAARLELVVPCPTCNVTIGEDCDPRVFHELPHRRRAEAARVIGFREVRAARAPQPPARPTASAAKPRRRASGIHQGDLLAGENHA